jgi:hypothetical protein
MNQLISEIANTQNIDVINKISDVLLKYGRVYVVGKNANDKAKQLTGNTIIVSDECGVVCCGISK